MTVFEYLGVLLSVVMGLGVTHILIGISKTIHHRFTVRLYFVHTLWAFNVLIYIIAIWWGMFWWSRLAEWSFPTFLFIILYAIALFLAASLLYPWDMRVDHDLKQHFFQTRRWFFGILAACWLIDVPETTIKAQEGLRDLPVAYLVFAATHITLAICGAWTKNELFHTFYAVFWPMLTLGYLSFTTLATIAG